MAIPLNRVLRRPDDVAAEVAASQYGVTLRVVRKKAECVAFEAAFLPPAAFARENYPVERAHILVFPDGAALAVPVSDGRSWEHRNGPEGDLCLWYAEDPRELRWEWDDGFDAYVQLVHRHLVYEEFYRREGYWPVEQAPHGLGGHPVTTLEMKLKQQLWRR